MNVTETKFTLKNLPPRESVMLQGPHGTGKSGVVEQVARELSIEEGKPFELIDLRLSQKEVGDLVGMPRTLENFKATRTVFRDGNKEEKIVTRENVTVFNLPDWFPTEPDSCGILFLDELNRATREVQQAAFELVLDYRLNFHDLPVGWRVVSAINDDTDIYAVMEIDPALQDRFQIINFRPLVKEWMTFANDVGAHDAVIKYITKFDGQLDVPEKIEPGKVYPSRRSWIKLSNTINYMGTRNINLLEPEHKDYLIKLASGRVGSTVAVHFQDFIQKDYKVLTPADILNRMNRKLEDGLKKMQVAEVGYYNKIILDYLKKKPLEKKQEENLFTYYKSIPKEAAADFWNGFIRELKEQAVTWWHNNPDISKYTQTILGKSTAVGL